jgi:hypothetical protein
MFVPCINDIKALFIFHNDAHNYKITGILIVLIFLLFYNCVHHCGK